MSLILIRIAGELEPFRADFWVKCAVAPRTIAFTLLQLLVQGSAVS